MAIAAAAARLQPDLRIEVLPGGRFANVEGVDAGDTAFAIANGPAIADAAAGRAPFDAPVAHVCTVARLYGQELPVAARAAAGPTQVRSVEHTPESPLLIRNSNAAPV